MYITTALLGLLFSTSLASSAPLEDRALITANTIIKDIKNINTGVNHARTAIKNYNGGLVSETPVAATFAEIHLANRKGFADANLASPFNAADSTRVVQVVIDTVEKSIPASIQDIKAKKPLFEKSGQTGVIAATLKVLLNDHDTFSAAVGKLLTADQARAVVAVAVIHDAIQDGIDYYST